MADLKKQCICIQFQFTLGKNTTERHEMFRTAFGDDTDLWFSQFKSQKTSAAECEHSGHLSTDCTTENVDRGIKTSNND